MEPDLRNFEPVECPDCKQQLFILAVEGAPTRARFVGCRCQHDEYLIPDSVALGLKGTPLFLFKKKGA